MSNVNDVEKRWRNPATFRSAVTYAVVVIVVAALPFVLYAFGGVADVRWLAATPAILFIGALGAFGKTYREWRAGGTWPIWQGSGWFLLALTLMTMGVPFLTVSGVR